MLATIALSVSEYVGSLRRESIVARRDLHSGSRLVSTIARYARQVIDLVHSRIPVDMAIHPRDLNTLFVAYGGKYSGRDILCNEAKPGRV